MHDIKAIEADPDFYVAALESRGVKDAKSEITSLLRRATRRRQLISQIQEYQNSRNLLSQNRTGKPTAADLKDLKIRSRHINLRIESLRESLARVEDLNSCLLALPNLPHDSVPVGLDEAANVDATPGVVPAVKAMSFAPKDHVALGESMGLMDFEQTTKISGTRFVTLKGPLARLERVLGAWMLDEQVTRGYVEHQVPQLVRGDSLVGTGQFPKFKDDVYGTGDHYLIPTAEVPLTNLVRESILSVDELPMRMTALTACFRSEAGSAGKDTRGLIRQHQFNKVELVSICTPDQAEEEFLTMQMAAQLILNKLRLPYRVMLLCTGDMGFSAKKTYDLEVWLPSQDTFREISSISWCGDFQARRMQAKFRPAANTKAEYLHTLNGSGLAVGRALVAVMENYQREDGGIDIPTVLQPMMGGIMITPEGKLV
jgi:seryl-tRNA synthetase